MASEPTRKEDDDFGGAFNPFESTEEHVNEDKPKQEEKPSGNENKNKTERKKRKKKKVRRKKKNAEKEAKEDQVNSASLQVAETAAVSEMPEFEDYKQFLPPPPEEAGNVTSTAGGMAMDSLLSGRVLPFDRKAYLHSLHTRLQEMCPRLTAPSRLRPGTGPRPNAEGVPDETPTGTTGVVEEWDAWFDQNAVQNDDPEATEKEMKVGILEFEEDDFSLGPRQRLPPSANKSDYYPVNTPYGIAHYVGPVGDGKIVEVELSFGRGFLAPKLISRAEDNGALDVEPTQGPELIDVRTSDFAVSAAVQPQSEDTVGERKEKIADSKEMIEEEHSSDEEGIERRRKEEFDSDDDPFNETREEVKDLYGSLEREQKGTGEITWAPVDATLDADLADIDEEGEDCD